MRHRRNSPAVTRNEEHRICLNSGQTQVDDSFRLPLGFKGIEVAGQARKIVTNTHRYTVGRAVDRMSVPLASYTHFAAEDLLTRVVMERMLAGVATRRHARTAGPVGAQVDKEAKSTSRSAISRRFVKQTETALAELMARDLAGEDIKVLMLDGEHMAERCVVVALAITADDTKKPVGLWDGSRRTRPWCARCWPTWSTAV
jgi:hypothetical protein